MWAVSDGPTVEMWTDGACKGNPGVGGWGAWMRYGEHERELFGGEVLTTNNRMELTAVIEGMRALTRPCDVTLHVDSQYVMNGVTSWIAGWKRNGWQTGGEEAGQESGPVAGARRRARPAHGPLGVGQGARRGPGQRASRRAGQPWRREGAGRGLRSRVTR